MFLSTPKELAPEEDQGAIFALIKTPQYANLDYMEKATAEVQAAADQIPEKDHVFLINGSAGVHQGFGGLILKPWSERNAIRRRSSRLCSRSSRASPGAQIIAFSPPALPGSTGGPPASIRDPQHRRLSPDRRRHGEGRDRSARKRPLIFTDSDLKFVCRKLSSRSTPTGRTGSGSTCRKSAPRSPLCSAAITSIASVSAAAAMR